MADAGCDSLTIDLQCGIQITRLRDIDCDSAGDFDDSNLPLARVPSNEPGIILKMLRGLGIVCPMINTTGDARDFVFACQYLPHGRRSFGPIRAPTIRRVPTTKASHSP